MIRRLVHLALPFLALALSEVGVVAQGIRSPRTELPLDTMITRGTLSNGLTYYIRANRKPEKRAELRLAVNAGSVLEDPGQEGLAHFIEHMAFNGTRNFKRQELVHYLESVGVRFGADLNASTGFDETVFMLQVPTDSASILEKGFDILEDWAHLVSLEGEEIDRERGVIVEEWRLGRGANARVSDKQLPVLLRGSRYADRLPIGTKKNLETFRHDTLRAFYRTWYRPDLMAIVAVGDFDPSRIEALITKHFSGIPAAAAPRRRIYFGVPDHADTLFAIATDRELTSSTISLTVKLPADSQGTFESYRQSLLEQIAIGMFNARLGEVARTGDPPFLYSYAGKGPFVRTKSLFRLAAAVRDNGLGRGFAALLAEQARASRSGFTAAELDRQKQNFLRSFESAFEERDKTESRNFAEEYVRNFLTGEPAPGIAFEYALAKQILPALTLEDVTAFWASLSGGKNLVVTVSAPEKEGVHVPSESELRHLMDSVGHVSVSAYVDTLSVRPLIPTPPAPGSVVAEREIGELGLTEWTLSNGARVFLKPSDFKNDEILFQAFSPGGTSLANDTDYVSAASAGSVLPECGLGAFDRTSLQKLLAGKLAGVSVHFDELDEGLSGMSSPKDLKTLFELLYLTATSPRKDTAAFSSFLNRMRAFIQNRGARPETAFQDTLGVTLAQYHPRRKPLDSEMLSHIDLDKSYQFYRSRFADASDFTFIFVGSFTLVEMKPLVERFVATLPSTNRKEEWRDVGIRPPRGVIRKEVRKGIEPKSLIRLVFSGPAEWSEETRSGLTGLSEVLRIRLREVIREEKAGTYGVSVGGSPIHYPRPEYRFSIGFGCSPDRVEELLQTVFAQIDSLRKFEPDASYITKVKETLRRGEETSLKQNQYWLSSLQFCLSNGEDPRSILAFEERLKLITPEAVRRAAEKFLDPSNYVQVILLPETEKK